MCPESSYYAKEQCCWLNNETYIDSGGNCPAWHEWATHLSIDSSSYIFDYFIYVSFSVALAGLAGLFVVVIAPYAAGSGIPEVCIDT